jgi:hypothetical protein
LGEALNVIKDDWKSDTNIGGAAPRCNRPEFLRRGIAGGRSTGYLLEFLGGVTPKFTTMWLERAEQLGAVIQQRHITIE